MNKLFARLSLVLAMLVTACGDNGLRSPDFDAVLIDILVDGPAQRVAGTQAQFRALGRFTTPPSNQGAVATSDITSDAAWSIVQIVSSPAGTSPEESCRLSTQISNAATVNSAGLVNAISPGTVYVKAAMRDKAGCRPFTITPTPDVCETNPADPRCDVLTGIIIQPDTQTTSPGVATAQCYLARGVYRNSGTHEITDTTVIWASGNVNIATVPAPPNNTGSCIFATGVADGTTFVQASATNSTGATVSDTAAIIVDDGPDPVSLLRVVPPNEQVQVGSGREFVACGIFDPVTNDTAGLCFDNRGTGPAGHVVDDGDINWTAPDTDVDDVVATIDENGFATGVTPGTATITATLKPGVGDPAPAQRSANTTLRVIPLPPCTIAFLASTGATVDTDQGPLCLACSVENEGFVIDAPPTDPASPAETATRMNVTLSALDLLGVGFISLRVFSDTVINPAATPADPGPATGFLVERPVNDLLLAEVLAQTSIQTFLGDEQQQTTAPGAGSDPLVVALLGTAIIAPGIGEDERILLAIEETTAPFDSIQLTFSPAVASALATLDVFNACELVTLPEPEPAP